MWDVLAMASRRKLRYRRREGCQAPTSSLKLHSTSFRTTLPPAIERRNHGPAPSLCPRSRSDAGPAALRPRLPVLDLHKPPGRPNQPRCQDYQVRRPLCTR